MTTPILAYRTQVGGRGYKHPLTGVKVPSITTIIGALSKPMLVPAAAKFCAEYAVANWDTLSALDPAGRIDAIKGSYRAAWFGKADLGSRVHEVAEAWAKNEPIPTVEDDMTGMVASLLAWLDAQAPEFLAIEATVWSEKHGYAGTLDLIALMGGLVTFGDYKTGKAVYPEVALQIAAAANADYILGPDGTQYELPKLERAVAVSLRPQGYTQYDVDLHGAFDTFLGLLEAHTWQTTRAAGVLS